MCTNRRVKVIKVLFLVCLFFVTFLAALYVEKQSCMGIPLISEKELEKYTEDLSINIDELRFNDEKIATDVKDNTIFISQSKEKLFHSSLLQGALKSLNPEHLLFFLEDDTMENLQSSVRNGKPLSLIVVSGMSMQKISVIITTLPIVRMDGIHVDTNERGREIFEGDMTLCAGEDPLTKNYSIKTSHLEWKIRGGSTAEMGKKSWKLSLKNTNGENNNLELLGLGADDDWILNSMVLDNTRMKEKLFMDLWNQIEKESEHNYRMSMGEYVEVVVNGDYRGVYLLQRRLDDKYLELDTGDVLLKAGGYGKETVEEAYEIVTTVDNAEHIYSFMQQIFSGTDCSDINIHNLIDTNIMLLLMNARDNYNTLNMYYVLKNNSDGFEVFLVPWDTDQSLGVVYKSEGGFTYDYQMAMSEGGARMETEAVKRMVPQYDDMANARWNYLRKDILSEQNLLSIIQSLEEALNCGGSLYRDREKWEEIYGGQDNVDNLKTFLSERCEILDTYYN